MCSSPRKPHRKPSPGFKTVAVRYKTVKVRYKTVMARYKTVKTGDVHVQQPQEAAPEAEPWEQDSHGNILDIHGQI